MRTAFDLRLGIDQGRVEPPSGYQPSEGSAALVLGSDTPHTAALVPGDHAEIYQTGTFDTAAMLRFRARTRGPLRPLEGDLAWFAQVAIDDVIVLESAVIPKHTRSMSDLALPVLALDGDVHKLAFRLILRGTTVPTHTVEIPAFYVDALVLDSSVTRPQFVNRNPEPNEPDVPIDSTIAIDIVDPTAIGISAAATQVFVGGVLAVNAGVVQAGFNGARAAVTTPNASTLRIVLDPTAGLVSQSTVAVHVKSAVTGGQVVDATYSFTVEDTTPPSIISATSSDVMTIRVLFSEPMDPSTLKPAAFAIARTPGEVSVPVSVVAVVAVSDIESDLTLNQEITPSATYTLTVTGVTDRSGNPIESPGDVVSLIGFVYPAPAGRSWDFYSFLPALNQSEDNGDLSRFIAILQELGTHMLGRIDRFTDVVDPDKAPAPFVQAMLDDLANPFIDEAARLGDVDRRRLVQALVPFFKEVGVPPGTVGAIRFFMNIDVTLTSTARAPLGLGDAELGSSWVLGTSDEQEIFTYRINVPRLLTADELTRMTKIATIMKTEREFFKIIQPSASPVPAQPNHLELGLSQIGVNWLLH